MQETADVVGNSALRGVKCNSWWKMKPPKRSLARRCNARICERFEESGWRNANEGREGSLCEERKERLRPRGAQPVQKMKILSWHTRGIGRQDTVHMVYLTGSLLVYDLFGKNIIILVFGRPPEVPRCMWVFVLSRMCQVHWIGLHDDGTDRRRWRLLHRGHSEGVPTCVHSTNEPTSQFPWHFHVVLQSFYGCVFFWFSLPHFWVDPRCNAISQFILKLWVGLLTSSDVFNWHGQGMLSFWHHPRCVRLKMELEMCFSHHKTNALRKMESTEGRRYSIHSAGGGTRWWLTCCTDGKTEIQKREKQVRTARKRFVGVTTKKIFTMWEKSRFRSWTPNKLRKRRVGVVHPSWDGHVTKWSGIQRLWEENKQGFGVCALRKLQWSSQDEESGRWMEDRHDEGVKAKNWLSIGWWIWKKASKSSKHPNLLDKRDIRPMSDHVDFFNVFTWERSIVNSFAMHELEYLGSVSQGLLMPKFWKVGKSEDKMRWKTIVEVTRILFDNVTRGYVERTVRSCMTSKWDWMKDQSHRYSAEKVSGEMPRSIPDLSRIVKKPKLGIWSGKMRWRTMGQSWFFVIMAMWKDRRRVHKKDRRDGAKQLKTKLTGKLVRIWSFLKIRLTIFDPLVQFCRDWLGGMNPPPDREIRWCTRGRSCVVLVPSNSATGAASRFFVGGTNRDFCGRQFFQSL